MREFAWAEIALHVFDWHEQQYRSIELLPKLAEPGLLGVIFREEQGGAGMGYVEYAAIIEELSRVDGAVGSVQQLRQSLTFCSACGKEGLLFLDALH